MLLFCNSIQFQILLILYKPIEGSREHKMSIFNELAVTLYLYLLMCLTDFHGWDNLREHFGFALFILLALMLLVNLIVALKSDITLLLSYLRRKLCPKILKLVKKGSLANKKKSMKRLSTNITFD